MPARMSVTAAVLTVLLALAGCAQPDESRFRVSGTASVAGQPIPYGDVLFTPDGAKQNSGAQGIAIIRDGKFDTSIDGKGVAGGPTIIHVTGLTAPGGKVLCKHELKLDLPRAESTQDLDVPAVKPGGATQSRPDI